MVQTSQPHLQAQFFGFSVHHFHEAHVAVAAHVGGPEDGRHLVLTWGHLVVFHGHGAADLQHLSLGHIQQLLNFPRNGLEVIQISLLMTCGQRAKQGPPTVHQIWSSFVVCSRDHKELLLPAQIAVHGLGILSKSDGFQHTQTMELHGIHGPKQRSLFIDAFAKVGHEGAWNVEALVHHLMDHRIVTTGT